MKKKKVIIILVIVILLLLLPIIASAENEDGETVTITNFAENITYTMKKSATAALTVYSFTGRPVGGGEQAQTDYYNGYDLSFDPAALPEDITVSAQGAVPRPIAYPLYAPAATMLTQLDSNMQDASYAVPLQGVNTWLMFQDTTPKYVVVMLFGQGNTLLGFIQSDGPIALQPDANNNKLNPYTSFSLYEIVTQPSAADSTGAVAGYVTPSVEPVPDAVNPGGAMVPAETSAAEPEAPKGLTPGQTAAAAAGVIVILAAGGGTAFFALNAPDFKEVILLAQLAGNGSSASGVSLLDKLKYPFIYLKLRKYSLLLGLENDDSAGKLLKKVRLPLKTGARAVMDLSGDLDSGTYASFKIRHPKKLMNGKKDVTIAYLENDAILDQDHFNSKDDYVNIKYIEK